MTARSVETVQPRKLKRIAVVGATGSGKTTLARELATRLGVRHIELDALHWEPNWVEAPRETFLGRVDQALSGDGWIADGNYAGITWQRAETVLWLDYSLRLTAWRLMRRTVRRAMTREELWNGNGEPLLRTFTRDSIFLWLLRTYNRRRKEYAALIRSTEYQHLRAIRLRSPAETKAWLETACPRGGDAASPRAR
jgi:adenylate kinase family enzyme